MGDTFERLELQQKIVKLDAKVKKYIKHLEALEKNREFIKELLTTGSVHCNHVGRLRLLACQNR